MIAPTLGAIVLGYLGWRAIYGFLATAGLLLFAAVLLGFAESHPKIDPTALQPARLAANYARIFRSRICLGYTLVAALNFGCMFSYIASSPLVMMGVLGVSPTSYGWTFAATALGIMSGAYINGRLNTRGFSPTVLLNMGLGLSLISAFALLAISHTSAASVAAILPLLVANTFSVGFIGPNATQGVMHPMPDIAGVRLRRAGLDAHAHRRAGRRHRLVSLRRPHRARHGGLDDGLLTRIVRFLSCHGAAR